jgi:hypothetical protein
MQVRRGPESQQDVQRLLGRCLLRLQQYEGLLKALLARHHIAGPSSELEAIRQANADRFGTSTLGLLIGELFSTVLVPRGTERPVLPSEGASEMEASIGIRFGIEMEPEDHASLKASLKTFVDLRNDLVHHLLERFDLWTDEGCVNAVGHLETAYEAIDRHDQQLREWCQNFDESSQQVGAWLMSDEARDFLVNGIDPNGTVSWPDAGISRVLREAWQSQAANDWMRLDDAVAWITRHHPAQVPARYGCKSWREVVSKSRIFTQERRLAADGRSESWFRLTASAGAALSPRRS